MDLKFNVRITLLIDEEQVRWLVLCSSLCRAVYATGFINEPSWLSASAHPCTAPKVNVKAIASTGCPNSPPT